MTFTTYSRSEAGARSTSIRLRVGSSRDGPGRSPTGQSRSQTFLWVAVVAFAAAVVFSPADGQLPLASMWAALVLGLLAEATRLDERSAVCKRIDQVLTILFAALFVLYFYTTIVSWLSPVTRSMRFGLPLKQSHLWVADVKGQGGLEALALYDIPVVPDLYVRGPVMGRSTRSLGTPCSGCYRWTGGVSFAAFPSPEPSPLGTTSSVRGSEVGVDGAGSVRGAG
jgi:hypothetical protein